MNQDTILKGQLSTQEKELKERIREVEKHVSEELNKEEKRINWSTVSFYAELLNNLTSRLEELSHLKLYKQ